MGLSVTLARYLCLTPILLIARDINTSGVGFRQPIAYDGENFMSANISCPQNLNNNCNVIFVYSCDPSTREKKRSSAVFRGVTTGGSASPHHLEQVPRLRLAALSQSPKLTGKLDAAVTGIVQAGNPELVEAEARARGLFKTVLTESHMAKNYKLLIDMDGNSNSWAGSYWKMASGSLVLKVECGYHQWWNWRIQPWVHYVPVKCDLSDLEELIGWCLDPENEAAAIEMVKNSYLVMKTVNWANTVEEFADKIMTSFFVSNVSTAESTRVKK